MQKVILASLVWMAAAFSVSAAGVTNGNFSAACTPQSYNSTNLSGWTAAGSDANLCQQGTLPYNNPFGTNPPQLGYGASGVAGDQWAELNNGPGAAVSLSQTISGLNVGSVYTLTWDMKSGFGCCGSSTTPGAGVSIGGNTYLFTLGNNLNWAVYSVGFIYTGPTTLSLLAQQNGTDTDAGFDNVSITPGPEPSTLLLLGLGSAGLVAFRRFRRA